MFQAGGGVEEPIFEDIQIQYGYQTLIDANLAENIRLARSDSIFVINKENSTGAAMASDFVLWQNYYYGYGDVTYTFKTNFDLYTEDNKIRPFMIALGDLENGMHRGYIHNLLTPDFITAYNMPFVAAVCSDPLHPYNDSSSFAVMAGIGNLDGTVTHLPIETEILDMNTFKAILTMEIMEAFQFCSDKFDQVYISDPI